MVPSSYELNFSPPYPGSCENTGWYTWLLTRDKIRAATAVWGGALIWEDITSGEPGDTDEKSEKFENASLMTERCYPSVGRFQGDRRRRELFILLKTLPYYT